MSILTTSPLRYNAFQFCIKAHGEQKRKYTGAPYSTHPEAVAEIVAGVTDDDEMVAAALLHDVVEDTSTTLEEIAKAFGPGVAALVSDLTDVSRPVDGNRAARKAIDRQHTRRASPRAKTIKLADVIHNTKDITANDPGFAKVYLTEMRLLLPALAEGDRRLYDIAATLLAP